MADRINLAELRRWLAEPEYWRGHEVALLGLDELAALLDAVEAARPIAEQLAKWKRMKPSLVLSGREQALIDALARFDFGGADA